MGKSQRVLARARKYAAGGALGKSDLGDFSQSDPIREMYRAVMDQYFAGDARADPRGGNVTTATRTAAPPPEGDLPPIWRTTMQGGATPRSTPSNATAKQDLGAPATDAMPGIWNGVQASARPAAVTEDPYWAGMNPVDRHRLLTEIRNNQKPTPEQMAENGRQNMHDLMSVTPVVGNIMAAEDSLRGAANAGLDFHEGKYKSAALNSALALLSGFGAVTGMPTGKTAGEVAKDAGRTAAVFVPAEASPLTDIAHALRKQPAQHFNRLGGQNQTIYKETGRVFGPDGVLLREIPDAGMRKTPRTWAHGDEAPLKDVVDHPELFAQIPEKANIPVKFEKITPGKQPIARTSGDTFQLSNEFRHKWLRNNIAKLLQYGASKEGNMAAPMRHEMSGTLTHIDNTMAALKAGVAGETLPAGAALAYMNKLQQTKDDIAKFMADSQGKSAGGWRHPWLREKDIDTNDILSPKEIRQTMSRGLNERMAGNIMANIVKKRVTVPGGYPYTEAPDFAEQIVLPHSLDHETLGKFVKAWHEYGSGRQKFAHGGKVSGTLQRARQKLAAGGLIGHTPGRSDKLPVKAAEGSYVIPADVVAALGEGNSMAGHKVLFGRFPGALGKGVKKPHLATGGAVDIIVSDGEFIVTPEDVAALGGGDMQHGHDILDQFVTNTRQKNIQELASLPGPKT